MYLKLCLTCNHPLAWHSAAGCDEILELGDDGYPEVCSCTVVGTFGTEIAPVPAGPGMGE